MNTTETKAPPALTPVAKTYQKILEQRRDIPRNVPMEEEDAFNAYVDMMDDTEEAMARLSSYELGDVVIKLDVLIDRLRANLSSSEPAPDLLIATAARDDLRQLASGGATTCGSTRDGDGTLASGPTSSGDTSGDGAQTKRLVSDMEDHLGEIDGAAGALSAYCVGDKDNGGLVFIHGHLRSAINKLDKLYYELFREVTGGPKLPESAS